MQVKLTKKMRTWKYQINNSIQLWYIKTLKIDVKNINKNIKTIWRPIYDVIYVTLFEEKNIFPQHLLDLCKNDKHQFLPSNVKTVFKRMAVEQCLYAQVVLIC